MVLLYGIALLFFAVAATRDLLLPDKSYCGYQHTDDYYRNGTGVAINEFPWLAVLLYNDSRNTDLVIRCSGSLISNRYVLTAAFCISSKQAKLVRVRLGEYNTKNETDCTEESSFYECSEPPQEYEVEKEVRHPEFNSALHKNSIGIIRLHKKVSYSDYIRPICLPIAGTKLAKPGDILATSGWGVKEVSGGLTDTKKKILTKLITNEECGNANKNIKRLLTEDHICARELEENTEFSCQGDGGAPIIFSHRNQWHQEGILSFGIGCHLGNPEVYTKVANYVDWIKENLEP